MSTRHLDPLARDHADRASRDATPLQRRAAVLPVSAGALTVQRLEGAAGALAEPHHDALSGADGLAESLAGLSLEAPLQRVGGGGASLSDASAVRATASAGLAGGGSALPHLQRIQQSFGPQHDLSGVTAHQGPTARAASEAIGARAYAMGESIAFAESTPDLHTVAHEAAHVVQQRRGVDLPGGVGQVGDRYERHADQVADAVVAGQSAARLLGPATAQSAPSVQQRAVQKMPTRDAVETEAKRANWSFSWRSSSLRPILEWLGAHAGGWSVPALIELEARVEKLKTNPEKAARYQSLLQNLRGEIVNERDRKIKSTGFRLTGTQWYLCTVDAAGPEFGIYDAGKQIFCHGGALSLDEYTALRTISDRLTEAEANTELEIIDKHEIFAQILKNRNLGAAFISSRAWEAGLSKLEGMVIERVNRAKRLLVNAKLLTRQHVLTAVKFTGSDFHKGGQQVLFLDFERRGRKNLDPRRIVYKPSSIWLDAQLFGNDSFATMLDPKGETIGNYRLISIDKSYGFMEFVRSDSPASAEDVLGVYKSIAANMALAYLVGMDDIHQENVLLLKDRIQVIDMEATTGRFKDFDSQLWPRAFEKIKKNLGELISHGTLRALPATDDVVSEMNEEFERMLTRASSEELNDEWEGNVDELSRTTTRTVPIATETLTRLVGVVDLRRQAGGLRNLEEWQAYLDEKRDDYIWEIAGATGSEAEFVERVLRSPGTFHALCNGDVPYYTRDLSSKRIFDELGNEIDSKGYSKVGKPIGGAMNARRGGNHRRVIRRFKKQGSGAIATINNALLDDLKRVRVDDDA